MRRWGFRLMISFMYMVCTGIALGAFSVTIDQIEVNNKIFGSVQGMDQSEYAQYKVVVYIHTDKWHIHPYINQEDSFSWSSIQTNGSWFVHTADHDLDPDQVAALLVSQSFEEPAFVDDLNELPNEARTVIVLTGTEDEGKF